MKDFSYITNSSPAYIESVYQEFLNNPANIDPDLRKFFEGFDFAVNSVAAINGQSAISNKQSATGNEQTGVGSLELGVRSQEKAEVDESLIDWMNEIKNQ